MRPRGSLDEGSGVWSVAEQHVDGSRVLNQRTISNSPMMRNYVYVVDMNESVTWLVKNFIRCKRDRRRLLAWLRKEITVRKISQTITDTDQVHKIALALAC